MTTIGILGAGRVATTLAKKLLTVGHDVTIGSRNPQEAAARDETPNIRYADHAGAINGATVVINATPGDTALAWLTALGAELRGTILVDIANATRRGDDGRSFALCYPESSLAEQLQQALPDTRIVKTLNTMLYTVMTDPHSLSVPPTAFLSGDDSDAKQVVSELLHDLGWPPEWITDLGGITSARGTEAIMLLVPDIARRYGFAPFAIALAR